MKPTPNNSIPPPPPPEPAFATEPAPCPICIDSNGRASGKVADYDPDTGRFSIVRPCRYCKGTGVKHVQV